MDFFEFYQVFLAYSYDFGEQRPMIEDIFYYTHNKFGIQRNIDRHQIKFHELTFLIEGEMTYYVNDEKIEMTSGDIVYLPSRCMRQRDIGDGHNEYISINFHTFENLPLKYFSPNSINEEILLLLGYFDKVYSSHTESKPKKLIHILEALIMQISDNMQKGGKTPIAITIANYLSCHYSEKITLEEISQETYFSVAYCESEFRKAFGKSIIHYLIDLRISEAKNLLMETSLPCSVIANMVGFEDANYFSRIFKQRIGFSPIQYRSSLMNLNKSPV
jgi:YesN/AraC family two-component response regulator